MSIVYVVGTGPGDYEEMTVKAVNVLKACDDIVGYQVYVDLIKGRFPDKTCHTTPMGQETERCKLALELAEAGRKVALVCSGDAGIYGMAGLVYQLRGNAEKPEIEVVGGLTAACSGAARLGAPLTNDFAVISLSDILTPWEAIERRLDCAARGDFAIVLYNPGSLKRTDRLKRACDIILKYALPDTVCGIVRNIGRDEESMRITDLLRLRESEVDMFTTVFVGNSRTIAVNGRMVTPRGYRNV
ncbi:MAG: precorrin-3B C(17)-methyltransferase [Clostridia bacterium]|nr:precorrin-3B C(17)-methyltransferase [Clostridia bacterium]